MNKKVISKNNFTMSIKNMNSTPDYYFIVISRNYMNYSFDCEIAKVFGLPITNYRLFLKNNTKCYIDDNSGEIYFKTEDETDSAIRLLYNTYEGNLIANILLDEI